MTAKAPRPRIDHVARLTGPDGPFAVRDGALVVGGVEARQLAAEHGTPLFAYDEAAIAARIRQVRGVLPERFSLFYSIKANPNAAVLRLALANGCGLEVASGGELFQALAAGCAPENVIFAGPGKTEAELVAAVEGGIGEIHVEAVDEIDAVARIAAERGTQARVALRINPVGSAGGAMRMGGAPSPFGIDEEDLDAALDRALSHSAIAVTGVHLFMGTQILDARTLVEQYRTAVALAGRVAARVGPLASVPVRAISPDAAWMLTS